MLMEWVPMPGFACVPGGFGTLQVSQIIPRQRTLRNKRQEIIRPVVSLSEIKNRKASEPEFDKSIVVIEYPPRSEHGLL